MIIDSESSREKNTMIYFYNCPGDDEDVIQLNGLMMKQKAGWVTLSSISGREAIRLCKVPEMEFLRDPSDTVEQALDTDMERYQRPTDPRRRNEIQTFFDQPENYIINSSIMWLPDMGESLDNLNGVTGKKENWDYAEVPGNLGQEEQKAHPMATGTRKYRIQTEAFTAAADPRNILLQQTCNEMVKDENDEERECGYEREINGDLAWFDVCPNPDCSWTGRPGHLLDGQHRTRGVEASSEPDERMPVNIMEGQDFDESQRAKIFSEVNNTSEALKDLHRLNLAYRTETAVRTAGWNYDFSNNHQRRSYEVAAKLTKGQPIPIMMERIHLLPPFPGDTARRGKMMDATNFVRWSATVDTNYSSNWFAAAGPWRKITTGRPPLTVNQASASLTNFYSALSGVFAGVWEIPTSNNGNIQQTWAVQPVFKMYPNVVSKIRETHAVDIPTTAHFRVVLEYLQNIDFETANWRDFGSGQTVSGQAGFNHRTKILRALVDDFVPGKVAIPDTINTWIGGAPQIENLTSSRAANLAAHGTELEWVSVIDAVHHPGQQTDGAPLLSKSGLATICINKLGDDDILYEKEEEEMSHTIQPGDVDSSDLTPGDDLEIHVYYTNVNGEECRLKEDANW